MEETQIVNLEELEEKYGAELAEKLNKDIEFANKHKHEFRVEVVDQSKYFDEIAFVTSGYAHIYEVSLMRKDVISEDRIGWRACKRITEIMNSF